MFARRLIAALVGVGVVFASTFRLRADDDKAMLIELDPRNSPLPSGVSASGSIISGGFNGLGAFYWMPTTGVIFAGGVQASGVSRDGLTIVGQAADSRRILQAGIWQRAAEWRLLGSFTANAAACDAFLSSATGVSGDGKTVVGYAYDGCTFTHAFRWQESTGMVDLGSSVAGRSSLAHGISADASVVVGYQTDATGYRRGARWLNGREELMPGTDGFVSSALAANKDGSVIVGRICRPAIEADQSAWIWTSQGGTVCLPPPQRRPSPGPVIIVEAAATSDDGQVVGGSQNVGGSPDSNAIIWVGGKGAYLKDFLQANGVPDAFRTWINTGTITGISPDGRILVGWGAALGGFRGYMVILGSSRTIP